MGKMSDQHIEKQEELSQEELEQQDLDEQQQAIAEENILNTLQEAIEYADRATDNAYEAEIQASEAHTQAIEASVILERAIKLLKERSKK